MNQKPMFLSHSQNQAGYAEPLREHLEAVASRAAEYAKAFGAYGEAYLAGLLHDLGKYGDLFQRRLQGLEKGIDHWSAGAWISLMSYQHKGIAAALTIQGHHLGLQQASKTAFREMDLSKLAEHHPINLKLSERSQDVLLQRLQEDGLVLPDLKELRDSLYEGPGAPPAAAMLDVRMLFSVLVDADFIETEAHFQGLPDGSKRYRNPGMPLDAEQALSTLLAHLEGIANKSRASAHVNQLRADLLHACLDEANAAQGIFTLTAPTGTGKTLSSLAFALKHAGIHKLRRIVVVIPYLSIIEQTVLTYRNVFRPYFKQEDLNRFILEHHSLAGTRVRPEGNGEAGYDSESETLRRAKLLAENWDAPIIVTTSVQFLESLFANRPSACRKLHHLAESVVLFDEVQTLPTRLAVPTLATLSRLADRYRTTIVFGTATQPAFAHLSNSVHEFAGLNWQPREIVPAELGLFERAKRTHVIWPDMDRGVSWANLAEDLSKHEQLLCVVNLKKHALMLYEELRKHGSEGLLHLSTNMCPAHRIAVLEAVRERLESGKTCRLVSTQCVEAGVDVDFPLVCRAFGPLEAITQAGGRCNRNGRASTGLIRVFLPEDESYPDGSYRQAASITRMLLKQHGDLDIDQSETFGSYYAQLYDLSKPENQGKELREAVKDQHFVRVAQEYRVIEKNAINVLVAHDHGIFRQLADEVRAARLSGSWITKARPHSIGLFRPGPNDPVKRWLEPVPLARGAYSDEWFIYLNEAHYDSDRGLVIPSSMDCLIG
jgi:CRISPR-associated endonuclease/helicase Cas3